MLRCFYVESTLWTMLPMLLLWPGLCYLYAALCLLLWPGLCGSSMVWPMRLPMLASIVSAITNQDSTSSRLLPGSSYSCCIRNLHAIVHKQCHPVHITTTHEILSRSLPMIHLLATIRGKSSPVTNSLSMVHLWATICGISFPATSILSEARESSLQET
jgi:hypothetical protein